MLFLMENAHCATAGDTEQNGAKHFPVARRAIVNVLWARYDRFRWHLQGKTQNRNVLRASKKFYSLFFVAHEARYDFEFSLANASQINRNAPKARYECAPRY